MALNYDYTAGLFDGEGSFIVTLSQRKRKAGSTSIALYMWVSIGQSHANGKDLIEQVVEFLKQDGINAYPKTSGNATQLRIVEIESLLKFCERLSGKLLLKQEPLENFEMILRLRQQKNIALKNRTWSEELLDFYRTVAIIWDTTYRSRFHEKNYYESKLFAMLEQKGISTY